MPEPTTATAASVAAAASAISLAITGVDYYSLLYGLIGAMLALGRSEQMGRTRAIVYVMLATFTGAVIGTVLVEYLALKNRAFLIGLSLVGGIVAQAVATALFRAAPGLVDALMRGLERVIAARTGGPR